MTAKEYYTKTRTEPSSEWNLEMALRFAEEYALNTFNITEGDVQTLQKLLISSEREVNIYSIKEYHRCKHVVEKLTTTVKLKNEKKKEVSKDLANELEKVLFKNINHYCELGLSKPDLVAKVEWVLGSCKMS